VLADILHMHDVLWTSPTPWRSIAKGLDLFYLKPTKKLLPELIEISSRVAEVGPYHKVDLHSQENLACVAVTV